MIDDLHEAATQLIAARTEEDVAHTAVSALSHLTGADRCDVARQTDGSLVSLASVAFGPAEPSLPNPIDAHRSIVEHAVDVGKSGIVDDLTAVRSAATESTPDEEPQYRSLLCVPLGHDGLLVAADRDPGVFSGRDLDASSRLAALVAAAIERCSPGSVDEQTREEAVANVISHDVQNAIAVANARLELAMDDTGENEHLEAVDAAHARLLDMTEDLVTVLRTGDSVHSIEPADLEVEARRSWNAIETADATLEVANSTTIMADRSSLCQLLENLFRNAIGHGGEDVSVRVGPTSNGDGFFVEDDGPGIPSDDRDRIFEMGYTTGVGSTGYGLTIVDWIASAHAWEVDATASRDGGARFEVTGVEMAT